MASENPNVPGQADGFGRIKPRAERPELQLRLPDGGLLSIRGRPASAFDSWPNPGWAANN